MFNSNPRETLVSAVSNNTANPFATALEKGGKTIAPLIKYGVNPVNGVPLTNDLLADIIELTKTLEPCDEATNMVVVGERRHVFTEVFYNRAKLAFENAIISLNRVHDAEIKENFNGIYRYIISSRGRRYDYDPDYDSGRGAVNLFSINFVKGTGYPYINQDTIMNRGSANITNSRFNNPKLLDLEYYIAMPVESVLELLLSAVSADYANTINIFSDYYYKPSQAGDNVIIKEYDEFKGYLGVAYANLLASCESIVLMLYSEANTLIKNAYPNQFGMDYDTARAISITAENDAYYDLCYTTKLKELKV